MKLKGEGETTLKNYIKCVMFGHRSSNLQRSIEMSFHVISRTVLRYIDTLY